MATRIESHGLNFSSLMTHSLQTSTRLGRYEIRSKLGAGETAEVYLAEDTEIRCKVALNVLPSEIAGNKERKPAA